MFWTHSPIVSVFYPIKIFTVPTRKNGGLDIVDNIVPICESCNLSMSYKNMDEFIREYYPKNTENF